ncbi:MAG TPA: hypothetical protein VG323_10105 [Thermoanaerobaculia bacterium]|nr:hypothetical protein [Thermoanaerobaculia bacterium]
MIIEAITLAALLHRPAPNVTCHAGAVSYKFVGAPGTQFTYTGKQYTVPQRGWIELISHGSDSKYAANGRELALDVWPIDEFGTRSVPLPSSKGDSR